MKFRTLAILSTSALVLTACGANQDPTATDAGGPGGDTDTIVIGTANFPESEIIGQLWAEVLKDAGFDVEINSGIGSREVYMQAMEEGTIDLVPEYTGNLAAFYGADLEPGADADTVADQVTGVLPDGLAAGVPAPAESKDSYTVTKDTADEHGLTTIGDLAKLDQVTIAANPEFAERPYGPQGLTDVYGVPADKITLNPISDGGGPLTIAALVSGEADVANVYTTSPVLDQSGNEVDAVRLEDPENLIAAQNVLPIYRADQLPAEAIAALDDFNANLTTDDLVAMNLRNIGEEKAEAPVIATDFFAERK